jgi:hypothetical protein
MGQGCPVRPARLRAYAVAEIVDFLGRTRDLREHAAALCGRYIVEKYGIAGADLVTVGHGKSKPKDANAPMDPANRRVQVVNMVTKTASK